MIAGGGSGGSSVGIGANMGATSVSGCYYNNGLNGGGGGGSGVSGGPGVDVGIGGLVGSGGVGADGGCKSYQRKYYDINWLNDVGGGCVKSNKNQWSCEATYIKA